MGVFFDSNIPNDAHTFIGSCMGGPGVSVVAFTPSGGWVVVAANGAYFAEGIPQDCFTTLGNFIRNGWTVRSIAFPPTGGASWVVIADQGFFASNIPNDCYQMIENFYNGGSKISCVAFPPSGGDSWVIVANNALFAHNIDDECFQTLCNYTQGIRRATQVTFAPNGGWLIYGDEAYFARNIDNSCFQQVQTFENDDWLVEHVAFTSSGGWSVICNDPLPQSPDPLRVLENFFLQDANGQWHTIYDRMAFYGVPGASVAFIQNNAVAWRTSYGVLQTGGSQYVYTNTPFQAASISKPHTSIGVQLLAQNNAIALTDPVGKDTSWTVATRPCAQAAWADQSTVQLILQHMGGFIGLGNTNPLNTCSNFNMGEGGGFGGYTNIPGVILPTLDQVLSGTAPANSPAIEITVQPGPPNFFYSGMGYVVLMRMMQDVTGADFRDWMQQNVLTPLGMTNSTFALDLPASLSRAAVGHDTSAQPIPGLRNLYPEASAAGLYTNAGDLCQTIIMLNGSGLINGTQLLNAQQAGAMLSNQLGIFISGQPDQPGYIFNHDGENRGFTAVIQGYPNQGAGMAIMTNRDNGDGNAGSFHTELINALIRVYALQT